MLDNAKYCEGEETEATIKENKAVFSFFVLLSDAVHFCLFQYVPVTVTCLLELGISIGCHGFQ